MYLDFFPRLNFAEVMVELDPHLDSEVINDVQCSRLPPFDHRVTTRQKDPNAVISVPSKLVGMVTMTNGNLDDLHFPFLISL